MATAQANVQNFDAQITVQQAEIQATYLAYVDVFWMLMLISAAAVPLALILRQSSSGAIGPVRH